MRWKKIQCHLPRTFWFRLMFCMICTGGSLIFLVNIQYKLHHTRHVPHDPGGDIIIRQTAEGDNGGHFMADSQDYNSAEKRDIEEEVRYLREEIIHLREELYFMGKEKHNIEQNKNYKSIRKSEMKKIPDDNMDNISKQFIPPIHVRPIHLNRISPLDPADVEIPLASSRPWYMTGGQLQPRTQDDNKSNIRIFPEELAEDRIPDQLMYLTQSNSSLNRSDLEETPPKKILLWNGDSSWSGIKSGRDLFLNEKCPVSNCVVTSKTSDAEIADLVIYKDHFSYPYFRRPLHQIWMIYLLECPFHTQKFHDKSVFNWTATYRSDSTLVTPYERWQLYNQNVVSLPSNKSYATNKTKQVAWFVSNCGTRNGRLRYARELSKYITVDIYGACGRNRCSRIHEDKCFNMLDTDYKFYLAFENSNCQDYITEKFFVNGLGHDVIPIVMGARPEDYKRSAPYHSYIHVDEFSGPKELADYLLKLDEDDELYNGYFRWKGTGEFINTKFWCRTCALLHNNKVRTDTFYPDINQWWRGDGVCSNRGWGSFSVNDYETTTEELTLSSTEGSTVGH